MRYLSFSYSHAIKLSVTKKSTNTHPPKKQKALQHYLQSS